MNFYATSLQIASDWDVDHDTVLKIADKMPHPLFKDDNIAVFEAQGFRLAQVTESGYNAIVFYLPLEDHNRDKLLEFRESLFKNKSPAAAVVAPPAASTAGVREKVSADISNGTWDSLIRESFTNIHKAIKDKYGADPGYQNTRNYIVKRREVLNITV